MVIDWRKEEDKGKVVKNISALLFNKQEKKVTAKMQKQVESKFIELAGEIKVGEKVKMKKNHQVGTGNRNERKESGGENWLASDPC
jgi:DNA mismatch repair protein MutS2